ncbi:hypothetical protein [Hymenobacter canadensis]|uniref:Secreted protein n=1 Tax=Hymenobacter canadensis TaxID=2999067 RepID=A0ABY7LYR5_9BACT|nr:hypothetical protein [Hymenobacter canadensis]WBA44093.1 hypothetical protein O3303_19580 [Hymenobacter canadensis]
MLLVAFAFLPPTIQTHVAADLREQVCAHAAAESASSVTEWVRLLASLNPVLSWHPADPCMALAENGWERLLQFSRPHLQPKSAAATSRPASSWS